MDDRYMVYSFSTSHSSTVCGHVGIETDTFLHDFATVGEVGLGIARVLICSSQTM